MDNEIFKANHTYLENWISLNPNLTGFKYENNILITPKGEEINLNNFLVSELLSNQYFNYNKYSMSANEFIKLIRLHVESEIILNTTVYKTEENQNNSNYEYIKNIHINKNGYASILSSENNTYEVKDISANKVLFAYHILAQNTNFVFLKDLLKEINKEDLIKKKTKSNQYMSSIENIKFFHLININDNLDLKDTNYIEKISKFMLYLLINQDLLVGNAKKLLDLYNTELSRLTSLTVPNITQKYALHYYKKNLETLEKLKEEQSKKEAIGMRKASNGYTSLILLFSSVIITAISVAIILFS